MSTQNQTAVRLADEQVARLDAARRLVPRAAFVRHIIELGLAAFERNPGQPVVRMTAAASSNGDHA